MPKWFSGILENAKDRRAQNGSECTAGHEPYNAEIEGRKNLFYFYGSKQSYHAKTNMDLLSNDYNVYHYLISSIDDFLTAWDIMNEVCDGKDIDIVVVNLDGWIV